MKNTITTNLTPFTLDMYSTFTTDSVEERILENQKDLGESDVYDDYDWTYDMPAILTKLADLWCDFVTENYTEYGIIKTATVLSIHSPKYYNYTTDSANIEIDFNAIKLNKFIKENLESYLKFCEDKSYHIEAPLEDYEEKLSYYMESVATTDKLEDDWIMYALENVSETMYNCIDYTPATSLVKN